MNGPDGIDIPADPGPRRLDIPRGGPLDGAGEAGGARTAREARAHLRVTADCPPRPPGGDEHRPLPEGRVPREELALLRRVYRPAPGYAGMRERLSRTHLLALCGEPGTGRTWTGLALLAETTGHGAPAHLAERPERPGPSDAAERAEVADVAGPAHSAAPAGPSGSAASVASAGLAAPSGSAGPAVSVGPAGLPGSAAPTVSVGPAEPADSVGPTASAGSAGLPGSAASVASAGRARPSGPAASADVAGPAEPADSAGPAASAGPIGLTGSVASVASAGPVGPSGSAASTDVAGPAEPFASVGSAGRSIASTGPAVPTDSTGPAASAEAAGPVGGLVIRIGTGDIPGRFSEDPSSAFQIERGHGYLLELPGDVTDPGPLLDRLRVRFAECGAFGVVLVAGGPGADRLLSDRRHAVPYEPPAAAEVLERQLADLLGDKPAELLGLARATAARPDVVDALGLDEPRPGEAARLARHLAAHAEGLLSDEGLLERCRAFAPEQARAWFDGAGRSGTLPAALSALRTAALRIALAVFNGSAHSLTAEAAELLTWELAVTLDPQYAPGRPLFAARPGAGLAAARAVCGDGVEDLGDASVPVRAVRFQGRRLASAVLYEAWDGHHNVRGPMARWLRALCDDPRPQVWVRAAVAAGVLCARDYLYGFVELLLPLARADSPVQRMAAATALAEASRDEDVRPAVDGLLRGWALGDDERERETAALAHGYGLAAGSVQASLEELARLAYEDDGRITSYSVLRLLAGTDSEAVLAVLTHWLHDTRRPRRYLALLTVLRAVTTRTSHLWGLCEVPELEPYAAWPLATALLAARPGSAPLLAELLRAALTWARSAAAAEDALVGWVRRAARDDRQLAVLYGFLPRLAHEGDEPLDVRAATRIREVLEAL